MMVQAQRWMSVPENNNLGVSERLGAVAKYVGR